MLLRYHGLIPSICETRSDRDTQIEDDPLYGLPRVVSTAADIRAIFASPDCQANGLTFCTGSFGVRADNDLVAMVREFAPRIHFVHLRNVTREPDGSFHEADRRTCPPLSSR